MSKNFLNLERYISILDRLMKMYDDRNLADFEIGWGIPNFTEYFSVSANLAQWLTSGGLLLFCI